MNSIRILLCLFLVCVAATPASAVEDAMPENLQKALIDSLKAMAREPQKAVPPIKIPPDAFTSKMLDEITLKWYRRLFVEPALARMKARGAVAWEADARKLLDASFDALFTANRFGKPTALSTFAKKIQAAGCDDPAVLLVAAKLNRLAETNWRFVHDCSQLSNKGWDADPKTPAVMRFFTDLNLRSAWGESGRAKEHDTLETQAIMRLPRILEDGSFTPDEMEVFLRTTWLSSDTMKRQGERIRDMSPKLSAPKWVQLYLHGWAEKKLAWKERGGGWASTVTDKGWKGFEEHLSKARESLAASWVANPKSPLAATAMISVVMAGAGRPEDTERIWFDRAITAQADHVPAYSAIEWAYNPRWCGSYELMLEFGRACLATKRYDLDIPYRFSSVCSKIADELGDWHEFYRRPDVAGPLMELSEGLVKNASTPQHRTSMMNHVLVSAWLTGDRNRAAAALKEMGGKPNDITYRKFSSHRVKTSQVLDELSLVGSPVEEGFNRASKSFEDGKLAEAAELFKKIEPATLGSAAERVKERLMLIEIEQNLAKGDWVKLPVGPKLLGWQKRRGVWSGTDDGVIINNGNDGQGLIVHLARVGPEFEMKVEFSVDAKDDCCRRCELCFGWNKGFEEPYNMIGYGQRGKFPAETCIYNSYSELSGKPVKGIPYQDTNTLHLQVSNKKLTFTVNGKPAYKDITPKDMNFGPADGQVGVGNYRCCRMNTTRITKIEVRRLDSKKE